jgi:hypothetical protein
MSVARKQPTIVNKIEKIGLLIVGTLLLFRIVFGTFLDFFLLTTTTLLAVFYLWSGFFIFTSAVPSDIVDRKKRATYTPFKILASITMGVFYSLCVITILQAIFLYALMPFMLALSLFLILLSTALISFYLWFYKHEWLFLRQFYIRSAAFGLFILLIISIPLETRLHILYKKHPSFIEAYKEYQQQPESQEALDRLRDERSKFR